MFSIFKSDVQFSALESMYPSQLKCLAAGPHSLENTTSQYYGFVLEGETEFAQNTDFRATLTKHMYFSAKGQVKLNVKGKVVLIERVGYRGLTEVGGPIEIGGRLSYIDNCRTTILVHPSRKGDPVLNYLEFPPDILQTMHFHPTVRLGTVFEGEGVCHLKNQKIPLTPGTVFYLPENLLHCFESKDKGLRILAYHPESDFGPTDENHPMLNRTYFRHEE